ncbi:hypothetical protein [Hahella ganghwensis]|uniref:hypothetical protein n=1 Tax=Hahella ganghwensis TaxID=286420 RepID=UPI0003719680|nr:hypothetical protein [Hahella ganghwensis]
MQDISNMDREGLPSSKSLLKATGLALILGTALLITTVLPAEYGIDPTGLGEKLGLMMLNSAAAAPVKEVATAPPPKLNLAAGLSPVWKGKNAHRTDTLSVTLEPGQGAEIKARMLTGERFVFTWMAEGPVNFDMHGEEINAGEEFTSYWLGRHQTDASGSFEAPFDGTHGWYWHNGGSKTVKVQVTTSGFYEALYLP